VEDEVKFMERRMMKMMIMMPMKMRQWRTR
jgi:hypothetical protein